MTDIEKTMAALLEQVDKLRADNAYLKRENAQLWEGVHDRDDKIAELQQMAFRHSEVA